MEQFAQQEQSIMAGGVAVREQSASASKAAQLQQIQTQFNQQMDQMNMQISVSQYQYETQQQIYGLATTRVGLETQLLQLQMSQTDQQNASNAALLNIVNIIRNTPASQLSTTPQLMAALGLPYAGPTSAQVGPQVGPLGTPGTPQQFLQALQSTALGKQTIQGLGLSGLSTLTPAQEQAVINQLVKDTEANPISTGNLDTVDAIQQLYANLESIMTGAPASQFTPYGPTTPLYPAQGTTNAPPWQYSGSGLVGDPFNGTVINTGGTVVAKPGSVSAPVYYLSDQASGTVTPVYNAPTSIGGSSTFTVQGQGSSGFYTTPGFTSPMGTILAGSSTSGLGSQSGATTTLSDLLQYPGLGLQGSTDLSSLGGLGSMPALPPGSGPTSAPSGPYILSGSVAAAATSQAQTILGGVQIDTENQALSIASTRIGMEMKLLALKQQQNQSDLQVLNAYQTILNAIGTGNFTGVSAAISALGGSSRTGPGATAIEDSLYALYSERGRYGEGGVAGNYP
jgi:hypothetical protein